jgi:hypothetical protein
VQCDAYAETFKKILFKSGVAFLAPKTCWAFFNKKTMLGFAFLAHNDGNKAECKTVTG